MPQEEVEQRYPTAHHRRHHPHHDREEDREPFFAKFLHKKAPHYDEHSYVGRFGQRIEDFKYGAASTFFHEMDMPELQKCLHTKTLFGLDQELGWSEIIHGEDRKTKVEGLYRLATGWYFIKEDLSLVCGESAA